MTKKPRYLYLSHRVEWVEVMGEHGRVKVAYSTKLNDPSLTKMDPEDHVTIEDWIKLNDHWYRRMPRPNKPNEKNGG